MSRRFAPGGGLIIFRESNNPRPSTGRELTGEPNMAKDRAKVLNQTLRKIPLFMGLSPSQMDILLKVCHVKPFEAGEVICASNTDATVEAGSGEEALEALGQ